MLNRFKLTWQSLKAKPPIFIIATFAVILIVTGAVLGLKSIPNKVNQTVQQSAPTTTSTEQQTTKTDQTQANPTTETAPTSSNTSGNSSNKSSTSSSTNSNSSSSSSSSSSGAGSTDPSPPVSQPLNITSLSANDNNYPGHCELTSYNFNLRATVSFSGVGSFSYIIYKPDGSTSSGSKTVSSGSSTTISTTFNTSDHQYSGSFYATVSWDGGNKTSNTASVSWTGCY